LKFAISPYALALNPSKRKTLFKEAHARKERGCSGTVRKIHLCNFPQSHRGRGKTWARKDFPLPLKSLIRKFEMLIDLKCLL